MWLVVQMGHFLVRQVKKGMMHLSANTIPMVMRSGRWQFGTSEFDYASGVAADSSGGVYVVGNTDGEFPGQTGEGDQDAFIRKYNANGDEEWDVAVWDIRI